MTRIRRALALMCALVCVSGCTQSYGGTPRSLAPDTGAVADPTMVASSPAWAQASIQEPVPVVASPGNTHLPWRFVALSADGRRIQVVYVAGGGCTTFVGFVVTEMQAMVTLAATGATDLTQKACSAEAKVGAGSVTLAAPLGTRTLWHAPVSGDWVTVARVLDGG